MSDLADRIEAGEATAIEVYDGLGGEHDKNVMGLVFSTMAHDGCLTSAKALHEAVLGDEWEWILGTEDSAEYKYLCRLFAPDDTLGRAAKHGNSKDPAQAWLAAIVRAKESML